MLISPTTQRRSVRPRALVLASIAAATLILSGLSAPLAAAAATPPTTTAPKVATGAADVAPVEYKDGRYIVVLRDEPAATYAGGVGSYAATRSTGSRTFAPDAKRTVEYSTHLKTEQREVSSSVKAKPLAQYSLTTNGFSADLTSAQATKLSKDARVSQIVPSEILHPTDENTSTGYLGLEGDNGVWSDVGGVSKAGKGVVVGVIDTGFAPENPSFAGDQLGTEDGAAPFRDGDATVFHKSDGADFRGTCVTGEGFTAEDCTTKVIGARYFVAGFGAGNIGTPATGEYKSPRDGVGHGSHTASTAAGNPSITAVGHGSVISGVAPAAKIAVYKVCWAGPNPADEKDDGCATPDLLSAIDAATADGVDVINYSIGGGSATTTDSVTDQAFMRAASAGIFVAASAGNSGPDASTLDNAAPWETTVAASTIPVAEATVTLGDGSTALGASITVPAAGLSGSLVYAKDVGLSGTTSPELCSTDTLDPAKVAGKIVLCDRGESARLEKSAEVKAAGGIGMIVVNPFHDSTDLDAHTVPTIHVDAQFADQLHNYTAAHPNDATATFAVGNTTGHGSVPTPQVAGFSSRGPVEAGGSDIIKPDVAAPGVNILAAINNGEGKDPAWGYMSGTSMASPHVAGLAALYLGHKPKATPAEIKSAMMTTAGDTVDNDGAAVPDPFAQGNGQVTPRNYLTPGLVYLNDTNDWNRYLQGLGELKNVEPIDASDLNLASIGIGSLAGAQTVTRTVTATAPGDYTASISGLDGITTSVSPKTMHFDKAGDTASYTVTFTTACDTFGVFSTGYLTWKSKGVDVRSALAVRPVALDVASEVHGSGTSGSVKIPAKIGADGAIDLSTDGLSRGNRVTGTVTVGSTDRYAITVPEGTKLLRVTLDAADNSADLDLADYGITQSGNPISPIPAATPSADEQLNVPTPDAGTVMLTVSAFSAGDDHSPKQDYTLTSYALTDSAVTDTPLTTPVTPVTGHSGDDASISAEWAGLPGGSYLGRVNFGDTGLSTIVTVDAGEDVLAAPGTPQLSVTSGWVRRGGLMRATVNGVTPGHEYSAAIDGMGTLRTGRAPSNGVIDWFLVIPDTATLGTHTITVTDTADSAVTLTAPVKITPVQLSGAGGFASQDFQGAASARIDLTYWGYGTVKFHLESATGDKVYLDETVKVGEVVAGASFNESSSTVLVDSPTLRGSVTVVMPDGSDGPTTTVDDFDVPSGAPGTLTFAPSAANPSVVDAVLGNNSKNDLSAIVRYYGTDGRQVFADDLIKAGESRETLDLTGFSRVEYIDWFGNVIGGYTNKDAARTDTAHTHITQAYWGTLTATPEKDPQRPITLEMSFRYPANVYGFDLLVGEGALQSTEPFFKDDIPVTKVSIPGPIITRTMSVPENTRLWTSSNYEIKNSEYLAVATVNLDIPGVTLADLAPGAAPVAPTVGPANAAVTGHGPHAVTDAASRAAASALALATDETYTTKLPSSAVPAAKTAACEPDPDPTPTPTPTPTLHSVKPTISGKARAGSTLKVQTGRWDPKPVSLSIQWLRDGKEVPRATSKHYRVSSRDEGHTVAVRVTGTKRGYASANSTSDSIEVLKRFSSTPRPRVVGTAKVGHDLTVVPGHWAPRDVLLHYQWYRNGKLIHGATSTHYTLTKADKGATVTVTVTGSKKGYLTETETSRPLHVR